MSAKICTHSENPEQYFQETFFINNLLNYTIENISNEVDGEDIEEGLDVPVVVTGGISTPDGFGDFFADHLEETNIPFSISGVHSPDEPMYSVASGVLVAACPGEEEAETQRVDDAEE